MEAILENFIMPFENRQSLAANRIEALKTLTKLLLHEVESLEEISPLAKKHKTEGEISLTDKVQHYETTLICNALLVTKGNQRQAAKILGMKVTTLHAKIRRYEIDTFNLIGKFSMDEFEEENN
ncbi:MAG TPA: helix-turn-helix domain-containing protein [Pyrinomonadaceae bacterium]|nr:helix-turn-helix domain-containing protein [Pyrinomonadaceae bacterium]